MDTRDREAIDGLFSRLNDVEQGAGPRDAEAEGIIRDRLVRQPGAPYYMAQTIVMQDLALTNQQRRIEELEREISATPRASEGGFLSRMLGGANPPPARTSTPSVGRGGAGGPWGDSAATPHASRPQEQDPAPYGQRAQAYGRGFGGGMGGMGGGGFLAGAAQTAMGVAGGVLLGNALGNMFSGDETPSADQTAAAEDPSGNDAGGQDEPAVEDASADGGWFGGDDGGGGFDEI